MYSNYGVLSVSYFTEITLNRTILNVIYGLLVVAEAGAAPRVIRPEAIE